MLKVDRIQIQTPFSLNKWHLFAILVAGSLVRLFYGSETAIWNSAHDQIAWEIPLHFLFENATLTYKQLVNYPHEGGTVLLSLVSLIFMPFVKSIHILSLIAFLMDIVSRWIQIVAAKKLFGDTTALFFGVWTIFALPLMLPWGLAFFGLHHSSAWLFVFLYLLFSKELDPSRAVILGLFSGFAIWFSYHNIILIPAFLLALFVLSEKNKFRSAVYYILVFSLTILPHVLLRIYADHGFPFEKNTLLSAGRPSLGDSGITSIFHNFMHTALYHLPDSMTLFSPDRVNPRIWRTISVLLLLVIVLTSFVSSFNKKKKNLLALSLLISFLFAFSASSMFTEHMYDQTFYSYRHFTFICPLVFLSFFASLVQLGKYGQVSAAVLVVLCLLVTANYLHSDLRKYAADYKTAGWIMTRKYGNDVEKLNSFRKLVKPERQRELSYGYGWGLAVHNLYEKEPDKQRATALLNLYAQFPETSRQLVTDGMRFAFQAGVTPTLNAGFLPMLERSQPEQQSE